MKLLLIFSLLLTTLGLCHAGLETIKDIITDPVISRRCKGLLQERSEKLQVQQKLNSMLLRNQKLQDKLKPQQQVSKQKLKLNRSELKNNLKLTSIRIKAMEENIVGKGCPGISL